MQEGFHTLRQSQLYPVLWSVTVWTSVFSVPAVMKLESPKTIAQAPECFVHRHFTAVEHVIDLTCKYGTTCTAGQQI